jgi:hypothetical protein
MHSCTSGTTIGASMFDVHYTIQDKAGGVFGSGRHMKGTVQVDNFQNALEAIKEDHPDLQHGNRIFFTRGMNLGEGYYGILVEVEKSGVVFQRV